MRFDRACIVLSFVTLATLVGPGDRVTAQQDRLADRVELVGPFEYASAPATSSALGYKFANLAKIDPENPLADQTGNQTLSLFGREDLIASRSGDYASNHCAALSEPADIVTEIENRARATSIVVINESHERSEHRGFFAEVVKRLRPLGYDTLAIETLSNSAPDSPKRHQPSVIRQPDLPYFQDQDGYYLSEAGFGRLGRLAKTLGYRLFPYEPVFGGEPQQMTRDEQIARREEGQARNLAAFMQENPAAKLLIHVGYSHATEVPRADGATWMAARLKAKTGIDPLTISQTTCRGAGDKIRLSALPAAEPTGTFDLIVDHPRARFEKHRPIWRKLIGERSVSIPRSLRPLTGWRVIEARPFGEPGSSIPMDRVAIRAGENIALMLPPGRYRLRIIDVPTASQ